MTSIIPINTDNILSDEDLISQYKLTKDQHFLAQVFIRYTDLLYGVCYKYLQDQEKTKDAVMTIYQELVSKTLLHEIDNFKGWLYMLSKNYCLMQLRKEKKAVIISYDEAQINEIEEHSLDEILEKEIEINKLYGCIHQLQHEQKTVIELFYLKKKCYNEIKEITGLDWNKVRSHIQNGRRNLKKCMENK